MVEKMAVFRVIILLLFPQFMWSQWITPHINRDIRRGNSAQQDGKYAEAQDYYSSGWAKDSLNPLLLYNKGNAFYRSGNVDTAMYFYEQAAQKLKRPEHQSRAHYNLGNAHMQKESWDKAIRSYISALQANPEDQNARYNLAYALRMLQQQQQQQQQQDKSKQDEQQDQQQQQQQSGQESEQDKKEKEQPMRNNRMTREQAEQLIDAMNRKEEKLQEQKNEEGQGTSSKKEKDW
jgi:Ca-activated chloride channel homolog